MKTMSKKLKAFLFGVLFFSTLVFAQPAKNVKIWVLPAEGNNLSNTESRWLPDLVYKALREKFTNYSVFIVAEEDSESFARIQAKSYDENISESDIISMGKQLGANYVVRTTITDTGTLYNLNVIFQNLENAAHLAESNQNARDTESLYMNPGCAVNEAFIDLCDHLDAKFGTGLNSYNKRILRNGANDLSEDEELKYLADEEKRLNEAIDNLSKEIRSISFSAEADAAIKKTQLELKMAQEEEKLNQTMQRQKRLAQDAANRAAELEDQLNRSDAQKSRIFEREQTLLKQVEMQRMQSVNSSSVISLVGLLEAKKRAILEIRNKRAEDAKKIKEEAEAEISKKRAEIMDAPLRDAQKSSTGEMLPEVRKEREKKAVAEETRIQKEYNEMLATMDKLSANAENEIVNQIEDHKKNLKKERIADNIVNRELRLDVNRFLGERKAWNATVTFNPEGRELYTNTFDISYKALTKKEPKVTSDDYLDDVDLYNSLFSRGLIPVKAEMRYSFTAAPDNKPSQYILHVKSILLTHTETGEKILEKKINASYTFTMSSVYDIRSERVKEIEKIRTEQEQLEQEKQEERKQVRKEKTEKIKRDYTNYVQDYNQKTGSFGSFNGLGAGISYDTAGKISFDGWLHFSFSPYVFCGFEGGMLPILPQFTSYTSNYEAGYWDFGLGFNKRILFLFPPNLFIRAGVGGYYLNFTDNYKYIRSSTDKDKKTTLSVVSDASYTLLKLNVGVDIPLKTPALNVTCYVSGFWVIDGGFGGKFTVGLNWSPTKTQGFRNWWNKI